QPRIDAEPRVLTLPALATCRCPPGGQAFVGLLSVADREPPFAGPVVVAKEGQARLVGTDLQERNVSSRHEQVVAEADVARRADGKRLDRPSAPAWADEAGVVIDVEVVHPVAVVADVERAVSVLAAVVLADVVADDVLLEPVRGFLVDVEQV